MCLLLLFFCGIYLILSYQVQFLCSVFLLWSGLFVCYVSSSLLTRSDLMWNLQSFAFFSIRCWFRFIYCLNATSFVVEILFSCSNWCIEHSGNNIDSPICSSIIFKWFQIFLSHRLAWACCFSGYWNYIIALHIHFLGMKYVFWLIVWGFPFQVNNFISFCSC